MEKVGIIPNNSWGKYVPNAIKNQPWNLNAMSASDHALVHGTAKGGLSYNNALSSIYHQTPNWAKATGVGGLLSGSIHLSNATSSYSSFGQSLYNLGSSYFNTHNSLYNSPSYGIGSFK